MRCERLDESEQPGKLRTSGRRSGGIGRRAGLKIQWVQARVSSSLSSGTIVFGHRVLVS